MIVAFFQSFGKSVLCQEAQAAVLEFTPIWVIAAAFSIAFLIGKLMEIALGGIDHEENSEEKNGLFKMLFEVTPCAYFIIDTNGLILECNKALENMLGCKREELIGENCLKLEHILPFDQINKALGMFSKNRKGKIAGPQEFLLTRGQGEKTASVIIQTFPFKFRNKDVLLAIAHDVSERKKIESICRRYEFLINTPKDLMTLINKDYVYEAANAAFCKAHNKQSREVVGVCVVDVWGQTAFFDIIKTYLDQCFKGNEIHYQSDFEFPGFKNKYCDVTFYPYFGEENKVTHVVAVTHDITERKIAADTIKQSEEKYRSVVERASDGIMIVQNELIKYTNPRLSEILGYETGELTGHSCFEFVYSDKRQDMIEWYKCCRKGEQIQSCYETILTHKTGKKICVELNAGIISYQDKPADFVFIRDMSERKASLNALAAEKERLAVTLRSIGEGVITTDMQGNIVLINNSAEKLTGWLQEEALGKPLSQVFTLIDEKTRQKTGNPWEKVFSSGTAVEISGNILLVSKQREERIIFYSMSPIRDSENKIIGVVIVFQDITEKLKIEEELSKIQRFESLGILAGGIAHDFNNVLTAVLNNITLAKIHLKPGDESYTILGDAETVTYKAKDLTQQLLTFSKGGIPVKEVTSLAKLLKETAEFTLRGSNVKCRFLIMDNLWPVEIDVGQISQVIQNLVINAEQSMPKGGNICILAENIEISSASGRPAICGKYVKMAISDEGAGIPKEHLQKIFVPYFTTKPKGHGLGLATAYAIITKHSGYITVDSELGKGAVFTIYFPAVQKECEVKIKKSERAIEGIPAGKKGKILLMDDEKLIRKSLGSILSFMGYTVEFAVDGQESIEIFLKAKDAGDPFSVVILDLTVPGGMGGKEAISKIRIIDPDIKAIASSGYSHDPVILDFKEHGFDAVAIKPYEIQELKNILDNLI